MQQYSIALHEHLFRDYNKTGCASGTLVRPRLANDSLVASIFHPHVCVSADLSGLLSDWSVVGQDWPDPAFKSPD